jgi:DNA-binding NtrC family response regulator
LEAGFDFRAMIWGCKWMMYRPIILVVEDEPLLRMAGAHMVERAGSVPSRRPTPQRPSESWNLSPISSLSSDIDMPPSPNGMELAALVRDRQPVEIILVSGHGKTSIADLPAQTVIFPKPYKESEIIAAIRKVAA